MAWSLTGQLWNQIPGDMGQKPDWCASLVTVPENVRERLRTALSGFGTRGDLEMRVKRQVLERPEKTGPAKTWTVEIEEDRSGHIPTIAIMTATARLLSIGQERGQKRRRWRSVASSPARRT